MVNDKNITGTICNLKSKDDCYSATLTISDIYEPRTNTENILLGSTLGISLTLLAFCIYAGIKR